MQTTETREIPRAYQGEEIRNPKDVEIGERLIDSSYGRVREVTVTKRFRYSLQLEYTDQFGTHRYGQSLHNLRRVGILDARI